MAELNKVKVALLGSGTVGTGVYKLINRQRKEMPYKVGADLVVEKFWSVTRIRKERALILLF